MCQLDMFFRRIGQGEVLIIIQEKLESVLGRELLKVGISRVLQAQERPLL